VNGREGDSMDLIIDKKTVYKVNIYGKSYDLTKPNVRVAEEMRKALKQSGDEGQFEVMLNFLGKLGLPKHFVKITEYLIGSKKN
jgi:hypothetical protein